MTSLKSQYANEIAEAMAKSLGNEEFSKIFKGAELIKWAGAALENFKHDVDVAVQAGTDLEQIYTKHLGALQTEENVEPGTITKARAYMAEKAATPGHRQPGQSFPEADDECMSSDCMEMMVDDKEIVAAEFALKHIAKIADALDGQGFSRLANILDKAMENIILKK